MSTTSSTHHPLVHEDWYKLWLGVLVSLELRPHVVVAEGLDVSRQTAVQTQNQLVQTTNLLRVGRVGHHAIHLRDESLQSITVTTRPEQPSHKTRRKKTQNNQTQRK